MSDFSKYTIDQLQKSLKVIRSQNIQGETQLIGNKIEKELKNRTADNQSHTFNLLMIRKVAQTSISASSLRNQGAKGIIEIARDFLENDVDLLEFKKKLYSNNYKEYLDLQTNKLLNKFPRSAKSWGAARKSLNLFFRDILYNHYTRKLIADDSTLEAAIGKLEIPLDKDVALALMTENSNLKRWKSIKSLTPEMNEDYQVAAKEIAENKGWARIHLDLEFWRKNG